MTEKLKPDDLTVHCLPHPASRGMSVPALGSGIAIEHKPTGLFATCEEHRSQHRNREVALGRLTKLVDIWQTRHLSAADIPEEVKREVIEEYLAKKRSESRVLLPRKLPDNSG